MSGSESERGSRPASAVTRCVSEHAGREGTADRPVPVHYIGAALAVFVLAMSIRPILAALSAVAGIGLR